MNKEGGLTEEQQTLAMQGIATARALVQLQTLPSLHTGELLSSTVPSAFLMCRADLYSWLPLIWTANRSYLSNDGQTKENFTENLKKKKKKRIMHWRQNKEQLVLSGV